MTDNPIKSKAQRLNLTPQEWCDRGNASIARDDVEWKVIDGRPAIVWKKTASAMLDESRAARGDVMDRRGQRMSESDTFKLNRKLEELGATARYRSDGSRYLVEA